MIGATNHRPTLWPPGIRTLLCAVRPLQTHGTLVCDYRYLGITLLSAVLKGSLFVGCAPRLAPAGSLCRALDIVGGSRHHRRRRRLAWVSLWLGAALAWTAAGPLICENLTFVENLPAPHAGRLAALDRAGQTRQLNGAVPTQRFCAFELVGGIGEPQVGVMHLARQLGACTRAVRVRQSGTASMRPAQFGTFHAAR